MTDKDNYLQNAELSTEQNYNMVGDGIINNLPLLPPAPVPATEGKPLDKVKTPTEKKRSREWER